MFGSHLSIAGGMHLALEKANSLGMGCVQVFTKNQRQWAAPPMRDEDVQRWHEARAVTGIEVVVSHDSYLINLASPKPELRGKSVDLFEEEVRRCDVLKIPFLVTHPGAHVGEGEEAGLGRVVEALDEVHARLGDSLTITCLESTAGQGTSLGHRLEHLAWIIEHVAAPARLGVCLDTAHLLAAGYDLTSAQGMRATLREVDAVIGLDRVRVVHINDSKVERGSRVDRHAHLGRGYVSLDAFGVLVNHPALKRVPKILETPKEDTEDGTPWDTINLNILRALMIKRKK